MGINFNGTTSNTAKVAFLNVTQASITLGAGGAEHTLLPNQILVLTQTDAAASQDITNYLGSGEIEQLNNLPAAEEAAAAEAAGVAGTNGLSAAVSSSITGNFAGVDIDPTTGHWVLANGNQIIYPNSVVRQQPSPGVNSTITIEATMQQTAAQGSFGFAVYTDAAATDVTFNNGYLILYNQTTGNCSISSYAGGQPTDVTNYATLVPFKVDTAEHTYSIGLSQASSGTNINAYQDGILIASGLVSPKNFYTSGRFGFSTAQGASPILVTPTSVRYTIGLQAHESLSLAVQNVIGNVGGQGQLNFNPSGGYINSLPYNANSPQVLAALNTFGSVVQLSSLPPLKNSSVNVTTLPASAGSVGFSTNYLAAGGSTNNLLSLVYSVALTTTGLNAGQASWRAIVLNDQSYTNPANNCIAIDFTYNTGSIGIVGRKYLNGTPTTLFTTSASCNALTDLALHAFTITYYNELVTVYIDGTQVEQYTDTSGILGEGYVGIVNNNSNAAFNVSLSVDTTSQTYESQPGQVQSTIASTASSDGSYVQSGILYGRHMSGANSTDYNTLFSGSTLLYNRHAAPFTNTIATSAFTDGSYINSGVLYGRHMSGASSTDYNTLFSGSTLLYGRHASQVTGTIQNSAGTDGSYLVSGLISARHMYGGNSSDSNAMVDSTSSLLYTRHAVSVRSTVTASSGSDGSYLASGVAYGRHLAGGSSNDYGSILGNGSILYTRNTASVTSTIQSASGSDGSYLGSGVIYGRHHAGASSTDYSPVFSGSTLLYNRNSGAVTSTIASASGTDGSYVNSGILYGRHMSGASSTDYNTLFSGSTLLYGRHNIAVTSTVSSGAGSDGSYLTSGILYGRHMSGASSTDYNALFSGSTLLYNRHAYQFMSVVGAASGSDGSYLNPGLVSARHMYGGNSSDAGAMVDSTSSLLYGRHAISVRSTVTASSGSDGSYLANNIAYGRHLAGGATTDYNPILGSGSLLYTRNSASVTSTIQSASGSDGSYLGSGVIYGRHHSGASSTDYSPVFGGATLLYTRHAAPFTNTIATSAFTDGSYINSGVLYGRHMSGANSTDYSTLFSGSTLLYGRHAAPFTNTISSSAFSDGFYLNSSQITNRHFNSTLASQDGLNDGATYARTRSSTLIGNVPARNQSGKNMLSNPSFASNLVGAGTNISTANTPIADGWYLAGPLGTFTASRETYTSGATASDLLLTAQGTLPNTSSGFQVQSALMPIVPGDTYTVAATISATAGGTIPSGISLFPYICIIVLDANGTFIAQGALSTIPGNVTASATTVTQNYTVPLTVGGSIPAQAYFSCGLESNNSSGTATVLGTTYGVRFYNVKLIHLQSLDNDVLDGSTYQRMPVSNMDSNRRAYIDFSQTGHLGKNTSNIGGGIPSKNLIVNGNNTNGTGSVPPNTYGWTGLYNAATAYFAAGGSYNSITSIQFIKTQSGVQGYYQDVPVNGGGTYTFQVGIYSASGITPGIWIGNSTFTQQYNATLTTTVNPTDSFNYYSGMGRYNQSTNTTNSTGWQQLYGSFSIPATATSARVLIYEGTSSTNAQFFMIGAMLTAGNRIQDYIDHETNTGSVYLPRHTTGILPYGQNTGSVTSTIGSSAGSDGSYINSGVLYGRHMSGAASNDYNTLFSGSALLYSRHSTQVTTTITTTVGSDGSYLANGVAYGRHLAGGATNDYSALLGSGTLLYSRHNVAVTTTIQSTTSSDGSYLSSGILYGRHMSGAASNDYSALFSGSTLLYGRHATPFTTVIGSAAGSDGYYLNSNQITNRHFNSSLATQDGLSDGTTYARVRGSTLIGNVLARSQSGKNMIINPNFALNNTGSSGNITTQGAPIADGWALGVYIAPSGCFALRETYTSGSTPSDLNLTIGSITVPANTTYTMRVYGVQLPANIGDTYTLSCTIAATYGATPPSGLQIIYRLGFFYFDANGTQLTEVYSGTQQVTSASTTNQSLTFTVPSTFGGSIPASILVQCSAFAVNSNSSSTSTNGTYVGRFYNVSLIHQVNLANGTETNGLLPYGQNTGSVTSTISSTAASDGSYVNSGILYGRHMSGASSTDYTTLFSGYTLALTRHDLTVQTGSSRANTAIDSGNIVLGNSLNLSRAYSGFTPSKNLIINGNNCGGTGSIAPSAYGWTGTYGGTAIPTSGGTYNSSQTIAFYKNAAASQGYYQDVPVNPNGGTYTFQCLLYAQSGVYPTFWVGKSDYSTQYTATLTTTANSGDYPQFYASAIGKTNTTANSSSATGWVFVYGTFTIPSSITTARVLIYDASSSTSNGVFFMCGAMLVSGNRIQDYIDHEGNTGSVYLSRHSTGLLPYGQHAAPFTGTIASTPFSDNSYINSGVLYGRHMSGAASNDYLTLFSGSTLALTRHDTTVQTGAVRANTAIDSSNIILGNSLSLSRAYLGLVPAKNLVVNGNNCGGTGSVSPGSYGWTNTYGTGTLGSSGNYGNYTAISYTKNAAGSQGYYQLVPVNGGGTYTFQCMLYSASGMTPTLYVGNSTVTQQYNNTLTTTANPTDNPQFYSSAYAKYNSAAVTSGVYSQWVMVYGSFSVPGSASTVSVAIYDPSSTSTGAFYMAGAMLVAGNRIQDYIDHEGNTGSVYLSRHTTGLLPYGQHAAPFTTVVGPTPGSDGSYLNGGQIYGRHMSGASNTDYGTVFSGSTMLLSRHNLQVVTSSTGSNVNLVPDSDIKFGTTYWNIPGGSGSIFTSTYNGYNGIYYAVESGGTNGNGTYKNIQLSQTTTGYINIGNTVPFVLSANLPATTGYTVAIVCLAVGGPELGRITSSASTTRTSIYLTQGAYSQIYLLAQITVPSSYAGQSLFVCSQVQIEYGAVATGYKANNSNHAAQQFEHGAMSSPTKQVIASSQYSDGSFLAPGQISNRHFLTTATLDGLYDGTTYQRMPVLNMDSNRRALIDFSQTTHLNKILDNIADSSVYAKIRTGYVSSGVPSRMQSGKNMLANPSFQNNTLGASGYYTAAGNYVADNWAITTNYVTGALYAGREGATNYVGSSADLLVRVNGTVPASISNSPIFINSSTIPCNAGDILVLTANYNYSPSAAPPSGVTFLDRLTIIFYDVNGNSLGQGGSAPANAPTPYSFVGAGGSGSWNYGSGTTGSSTGSGTISTGQVLVPTLAASCGVQICRYLTNTNSSSTSVSATIDSRYWNLSLVHVINSDNGELLVNKSSFLNSQGSTLNWAGTPLYSYTITTSSVAFSIPSATFTRNDTTTITVPSYTNTFSETAGTVYYNVYYNAASNVFNVVAYHHSLPTALQQFTDAYSDGRVAITVPLTLTVPSSGSGTGGTGGGGEGGGGTNSCPAEHQLVKTRERGYIRADQVDIGMHFPAKGDWVKVNEATRLPTTIWRFTVESPNAVESFDVNDTHAVQQPNDEWLIVTKMRPGMLLKGNKGHDLVITDVHEVGPGHYIAFDVDTHEFEMGETCAHNIVTY